MKNKLNKEEQLLHDKLEHVAFDFKEADWAMLEQQLPKPTLWSKYGTAFKAAAALIIVASAVYLMNDEVYSVNEENAAKETTSLIEKNTNTNNSSPISKISEVEEKTVKENVFVEPSKKAAIEEKSNVEELKKPSNEVSTSEETIEEAGNTPPIQENESAKEVNSTPLRNVESPASLPKQQNATELAIKELRISENRCTNNTIVVELIKEGEVPATSQLLIEVNSMNGDKHWQSHQSTLKFNPKVEGNYQVSSVLIDDKGQKILLKRDVIHIENVESTNFTYEDQTTPFEDLQLKFSATHSIGDHYTWIIEGNEYSTNDAHFTHEFMNDGVYDVSLIETFHNGCTSIVDKPVAVSKDFDPTVETDFTPNGDRLNDEFMPEAFKSREEAFSMVIHSRSGGIVFRTNSVNKAWNGRLNNSGEMLPVGLYIWKASLTNEEGKVIPFTGRIRIKDF